MTAPAAPRPLRERLRAARLPAFGGLRGFWSWWGQSLLAWLPRSWRRVLGLDRGRLLLQLDVQGVQLRVQDEDGVRDVARLPALDTLPSANVAMSGLLARSLQDLPRWLVLPASVALRRRMTLPAAAAERLRDVIGFEIDRQTPFAADAVAYDARLLGPGAGDAQLDVELIAVPHEATRQAEVALGDLSEHLAGIDVLDMDGVPLAVNLLPPERRRVQADPMRNWNLVLATLALLAGAAMLWQILDNRRTAADAFEQIANQRARAARGVAAQRQELVDSVQGQVFLDEARAGRPTAVEVLEDLSRRIPDDTHLEKLAIEGGRITLIGRSSEASALPARLEGSRLWRAPALAGALQSDPRSGRDIFTLTAELATAPTKPAEQRRDPNR